MILWVLDMKKSSKIWFGIQMFIDTFLKLNLNILYMIYFVIVCN
jgi:hypothetical protein